MKTPDHAAAAKHRPRRAGAPRDYREGANVLKALGHPSRLLMIDELSRGERSVAELTALVGNDISTVSNHLSVLRNAGVVLDERRGQQVFYRLAAECVGNVFHCLREMRTAREKTR